MSISLQVTCPFLLLGRISFVRLTGIHLMPPQFQRTGKGEVAVDFGGAVLYYTSGHALKKEFKNVVQFKELE